MPETEKIGRDVRVDQIGFANELQKQHADDLKSAIKTRMLGDGIDRVEGDYFEGLLITGATRSTVDPLEFFALFSEKKITEEQLLSAITVRNEPCGQFLSRDALAAISREEPASPTFRVTRKKGVEILLSDALAGLGAAIARGKDVAADAEKRTAKKRKAGS